MKTKVTTALIAVTLGILSSPVQAQRTPNSSVSLELRDAPVRSTLEAIFKQAGIKNYLIENGVQGFVTLTLTEQPMESALKLVMRASSLPLTYTVENDVWIVKPRRITPPVNETPTPPSAEVSLTAPRYERISLTYLDAADLDRLLGGIIMIRQFTRQGGGFPSGSGVVQGNGAPGQPGGIVLQGGGGGTKPQ